MAADGHNYRDIGEKLGLSPSNVHRWRTRFVQDRLNGMVERPRLGRPRQYTDEDRERVVSAVQNEAPPRGATRWTVRSLAEGTGVPKDTVHWILREEELAPHRLTTWAPAMAG